MVCLYTQAIWAYIITKMEGTNMKLSKRLLSVVLTVAMLMTVIGVLPMTASADTYTVGTGTTVQIPGAYRYNWPGGSDENQYSDPTTFSVSPTLDARVWIDGCPIDDAVDGDGVTIAFDVTLPASNGVPVYYTYSESSHDDHWNVFFGFEYNGNDGYRLLSKFANESDPYYNNTVYPARTAIPVILYIQDDTFELYVDGEQIATVDTDIDLSNRWFYAFYYTGANSDTSMIIGNLQYLSGKVIDVASSGSTEEPTAGPVTYYAGPYDFESSAVDDNVNTVVTYWISGSDFTVQELNGGKAAHLYRSGYDTIQMDLPGSCWDIATLTANKFVYEFDLTVDKADSDWQFGTDNGNYQMQKQWEIDRYGRVHLYTTAHDQNDFTISANTTYRFSWVIDVANDAQVLYVDGVQILSGALNGDMSALRTLKMINTLNGYGDQDINFYMDNISIYEYNLARIESNASAPEEPTEAPSEEPSAAPTEVPTEAPAFTADISPASASSGESFTVSGDTPGATDEVTVFVFGRTYTTNAVDNAYSTTITIPAGQAAGIYSVVVTDTDTDDSDTLDLTVSAPPSNYIYQNDFEKCSTSAVFQRGQDNGISNFNTNYADTVGFTIVDENHNDHDAYNGIRTDISGPGDSTQTFGQWSYADGTTTVIGFNTSVLTGDALTSYNTADTLTYQFDIYFPSENNSSEELTFRLGNTPVLAFRPTYNSANAPIYYFDGSATGTLLDYNLAKGSWYTVTLSVNGTSGTISHSASIAPYGGTETTLYSNAVVNSASTREDLTIYTYKNSAYAEDYKNTNWAMDNFTIAAPAPEAQVEISYLTGIKHGDDPTAMAFITEVVVPAAKMATLYMTVGRAAEFAFATNVTDVTVKYAAYIGNVPDTAAARATAITASVRAAVNGVNVATATETDSWNTAEDISGGAIISGEDMSGASAVNLQAWLDAWN